MCRNIKTLYNFEPPTTEDEVRAAALQYVRKVSGFNKPSKANEEAFLTAIGEIAAATAKLLDALETSAPPKIARSRRRKRGRARRSDFRLERVDRRGSEDGDRLG